MAIPVTSVDKQVARYERMVQDGSVFFACNSAAQALSLNSTTATGFILTNPAASGFNLVLLEICVALTTAPAGAAPLILTGTLTATGSVTHTTPLTVRNARLADTTTGVGLCDSAATLPAATIARPIGGGPVAASSINSMFIKDEIGGALILKPQTCISVQCLTTAISAITSMTWREVPA